MKRSGVLQIAAGLVLHAAQWAAHADTSPQELLAMVPAGASAVIIIPNLKFCSDEITRCLEGMDRANLLLGTRPLDQLKSFTGFNVGINDVGGAAMMASADADDRTLHWTYVIPVSDGEAFLSGNFKTHVKDNEYTSAGGKTYHAQIVGSYAVVADQAGGLKAAMEAAGKPDDRSPWQNLGNNAANVLGSGEIIVAVSSNGARRLVDRARAMNPLGMDERAAKRFDALSSPSIDQLRIGIATVNFDPLGVITRTLSLYEPGSAMGKQLRGGKADDEPPLSRLPNKPAYIAASVDVQGMGGPEAMRQLCTMLGLPEPPPWLAQAAGFEFAAYPSPAGLAGGLLNDSVLVMRTSAPQQAREALKASLVMLKDRFNGVKSEVTWSDNQPVKNATPPMSADQYEVAIIDVAPEQAMIQAVMPIVFGRAGWRGFVKPTDDALAITFSQRPAVLAAALSVKPESSYGATGVIRTMHKWIPSHSDIEIYFGAAQLAQMARQAAESFGVNEAAGVPGFEPNAPPVGFAADVDQGTLSSTTVVPAAILTPLVDQWIGMMKEKGRGDDEPLSPPPQSSPASGERP